MPDVQDLAKGAADTIGAGVGAGGAFFGLRWLLTFFTKRADARQAQLDAEHDALDTSWATYRKNIETRLSTMERQNRALRLSFEHVAGALIRKDPDNPALVIADRIMAQAFPDDFSLTVPRRDQAGETVGAG